MRDPSALTIIARVLSAEEDALRAYLKTRVNPEPGGASKDLSFENYPNLHFLSFCMPPLLEGGEEDLKGERTSALLVMETTFDGPEDAFIRDLVACDLDPVINIFGKCAGFPKMARENPHLVEIFLKQHSRPSQTFFSGAPGKTVVQIQRERSLRRRLGDVLRRAPQSLMAAEPRRLQDHLRRAAMRDDEMRLMSQPPLPTSSLLEGDRMMRLAGAFLTLPVFLIGGLLFCLAPLTDAWRWLTEAPLAGTACLLVCAAALLLALMLAQDAARRRSEKVNPRAWPFVFRGLAAGASLVVKVAMAVLAVRAVFLLAGCLKTAYWPAQWGHATVAFVGLLVVFAVLYGFALYLGAARASAGRLQRTDRTREDAWWKSGVAWAFWVGFWIVFAASLVPLAVLLIVMFGAENERALDLWSWIVLLAGWFSAGMLAILAIWILFLKAHDGLQAWENCGLSNPLDLFDNWPDPGDRWANEEHGYQRQQNHYISLTNVKKGRIRYCLLLLALSIVNFLARYKDNKGTLGGIPTIFSARWVLIDGGRRLLFLTNYSGAWDSYLNEFSELASVIGVNLIWTNTYIAADGPDGEGGIRFPETHLLTGLGARSTLPFKAFVRESQLETLVWFGAYRDLSVVNLAENARIREAVFGPTDPAALDLLLKRL